jgi:hypothetical protein
MKPLPSLRRDPNLILARLTVHSLTPEIHTVVPPYYILLFLYFKCVNPNSEIHVENGLFHTPVIYHVGGNSSTTFMNVIIPSRRQFTILYRWIFNNYYLA